MDNFKADDYQFKCNGINSGYKFYSNKDKPFESINALLIETRFNDDLAMKMSEVMSFTELNKIIRRSEEVVLNCVPTFTMMDRLKTSNKIFCMFL